MFSITSRERKVTNYVKQQAYAWLYNKICKGEYEQKSNGGLLIRITMAKKVDEDSYEDFLDEFNHVPYKYMLDHDSANFNKIYTRHIDNYFIEFNGVLLPVGFIKEFFEDDYETQADIREFYSKYLNETLEDMINGCKLKRNLVDTTVTEIKEQNKAILKPKLWYHIVNILIKGILPVFALIVCATGLIQLLTEYKAFFIEGDDSLKMIINAFGVALTILPTFRAIRIPFFYIRWAMLKSKVNSISKTLEEFDGDTLETFKVHFTDINKYLVTHPFIEDGCLKAPNKKKQYLAVTEYDKGKIVSNIEKLVKSYKNKINIMGGANKWFFSLFNNILWSVLGIMVNSADLFPYIQDGVNWIYNFLIK